MKLKEELLGRWKWEGGGEIRKSNRGSKQDQRTLCMCPWFNLICAPNEKKIDLNILKAIFSLKNRTYVLSTGGSHL
jgi:hypothetical protein